MPSSAHLMWVGVESRGSVMSERHPAYLRESADRQFAAWYVESWYYGHHYRFFSCSPWHLAGLGRGMGQRKRRGRQSIGTWTCGSRVCCRSTGERRCGASLAFALEDVQRVGGDVDGLL
jgi:hypothetical protein